MNRSASDGGSERVGCIVKEKSLAGAVTGLEAERRLSAGPSGRPAMAETRADIHTRITNEIVAAIEAGAGKWHVPWHHDGSSIARPINIASGKGYRGINVLALWIAAQAGGYGSGIWGTYRQWAARGCPVRKGEKATSVVFWKQIGGKFGAEATDSNAITENDEDNRPRFIARGYALFNRAQVDGHNAPDAPLLAQTERVARAEAFFSALGIPITNGGDAAFYRISEDRIYMPGFERFVDATAFYSTLAHERSRHGSRAPPQSESFEALHEPGCCG